MVTIGSVHYAVKADGYYGLSTDVKPTGGIANGSCFVEMDTGFAYIYDASTATWIEFCHWGGNSPTHLTFAYNQSQNI